MLRSRRDPPTTALPRGPVPQRPDPRPSLSVRRVALMAALCLAVLLFAAGVPKAGPPPPAPTRAVPPPRLPTAENGTAPAAAVPDVAFVHALDALKGQPTVDAEAAEIAFLLAGSARSVCVWGDVRGSVLLAVQAAAVLRGFAAEQTAADTATGRAVHPLAVHVLALGGPSPLRPPFASWPALRRTTTTVGSCDVVVAGDPGLALSLLAGSSAVYAHAARDLLLVAPAIRPGPRRATWHDDDGADATARWQAFRDGASSLHHRGRTGWHMVRDAPDAPLQLYSRGAPADLLQHPLPAVRNAMPFWVRVGRTNKEGNPVPLTASEEAAIAAEAPPTSPPLIAHYDAENVTAVREYVLHSASRYAAFQDVEALQAQWVADQATGMTLRTAIASQRRVLTAALRRALHTAEEVVRQRQLEPEVERLIEDADDAHRRRIAARHKAGDQRAEHVDPVLEHARPVALMDDHGGDLRRVVEDELAHHDAVALEDMAVAGLASWLRLLRFRLTLEHDATGHDTAVFEGCRNARVAAYRERLALLEARQMGAPAARVRGDTLDLQVRTGGVVDHGAVEAALFTPPMPDPATFARCAAQARAVAGNSARQWCVPPPPPPARLPGDAPDLEAAARKETAPEEALLSSLRAASTPTLIGRRVIVDAGATAGGSLGAAATLPIGAAALLERTLRPGGTQADTVTVVECVPRWIAIAAAAVLRRAGRREMVVSHGHVCGLGALRQRYPLMHSGVKETAALDPVPADVVVAPTFALRRLDHRRLMAAAAVELWLVGRACAAFTPPGPAGVWFRLVLSPLLCVWRRASAS